MTTLAVVGLGLIGTSIALAARKAGLVNRVVGRDSRAENLTTAMQMNAVDASWETDFTPDLICIAVPTRSIVACVSESLEQCGSTAPIFDVGSVKKPILDQLQNVPKNFVPCHPIAGSEQRGPFAANASLFSGRTCIVTPVQDTRESSLKQVISFWRGLAMEVLETTPQQHDEILSMTSHVPHLLSMAFVLTVNELKLDLNQYQGSGYRDFTRIAHANPSLWSDIFRDNATHIIPHLEEFQERVSELKDLILAHPDALGSRLNDISNHEANE